MKYWASAAVYLASVGVFGVEPSRALLFAAIAWLFIECGRVDQGDDPGDDVDRAHAAYVSGEIDESELERRLDLALDPETERIRAAVVPVNGVGPATAAALHEEFGTLAAVERADADELAHAHGVGEKTAAAIRERLS